MSIDNGSLGREITTWYERKNEPCVLLLVLYPGENGFFYGSTTLSKALWNEGRSEVVGPLMIDTLRAELHQIIGPPEGRKEE